MNSRTIKNIALIVLLILILFLTLNSFKKSSDLKHLQNVFTEEKADLKNNLDEMIKDYTDVVIRKKSLSKRLRVEIQKMKDLRDSVANLKGDNYNLIRRYRSKISSLERENRRLFIKIDSLNTANEVLAQENVITNEILSQKETINTELTEKYKKLEEKVAVASKIDISPLKAIAMKERSSGKLTSTSRSSRTDAFRINFDLLENEVTKSGKKMVYIQIIDKDKKVITPKGKARLNNGARIMYSDSVTVNYNNDKLSLVSFVLVNRDDINKGKYTISAFVDGEYSGNSVVSLR
ncbi:MULTISPECIES: hypothetical protein [Tenacibaculum]|uniref:hypothetical protein n=1 Tax=Tenacibaculum TaxID=104267 RepID=UPI00089B03B7|nr:MULTISPECIES: hypothetical protein [unclassified Tenacibaculum]RBW59649.1 hypothetical protein DS884_07910 [Tenacibaculum sp. E3R01]SED96061.1 hypothetical protein SAMN04487765_0929 [Tenacibaculum sp. MAR_2010_89]